MIEGRRHPKNASLELDQARRLPRYRMTTTSFHPGAIDTMPYSAGPDLERKPTHRHPVPEPGSLRGIPVIGHGGASPGTRPDTAVPAKLDRRTRTAA